ncbi:hypothetical protein [Salmonella enterica]|uniref:hypothetical protein n=1 Tax=Salmonella enterica TaxID=28901 RepID=UPI001EFC1A88|nr:hypothetical protein [Salmonella enterica]
MSKDEISYQILYRYYLEKLHCTLTRRVDNVLSFALMLFGVGVIVNVGNHLILGLCIVGISALKILCRFDTRSAQADRQSRAWLRLFNTRHHFPSDKSLFLTITSLEQVGSYKALHSQLKRLLYEILSPAAIRLFFSPKTEELFQSRHLFFL